MGSIERMSYFYDDQEDVKEKDKAFRKRFKPAPSFIDYAKEVGAATSDLAASVNAGLRFLGVEKAADYEKYNTARAARTRSTMTPGGQAMSRGTILPDEEGDSAFLQAPLSTVMFKGASQIPMLVASALPGGAIGRALQAGSKLVGGVTAINAGALQTGSVLNDIYQATDAMSDSELYKQSKVYKKLIDSGVKPADARNQMNDIITQEPAALAFVISTIANSIGAGQILAKGIAGTEVKKGLVKGVARGAGEEAVSEFVDSGSEEALTQRAVNNKTQGEIDWANIDWGKAFKQGLEGAVTGGLIGGVVGGVTNIGKPRRIPVVPGPAPDPAQATAVTGQPIPPVTPPPKAPEPKLTPKPGVGPAVVPGAQHSPPPGATTKGKSFAKKKTPTAPAVEASVIPDQSQQEALQQTAAAQVVQAPPEVVAPPPVAPVAPPVVAQQVTPEIPKQARQYLEQQRGAAFTAPPVAEQVVQPPVEQAPAQPVEPVQQPVAPVTTFTPTQPRVLPDLAAQARREAELDEAAKVPDEVASRGNRYQLGVSTEEVNNPVKHQAWRRKMAAEASQPGASEIATEAASIVGKRGTKLSLEQKDRLKQLNAEWIGLQSEKPKSEASKKPPAGQRGKLSVYDKEVKSADEFLKVIARENVGAAKESDSETEARVAEIIDTLVNAPEREDIAKAVVSSPYTKAVMNLAGKIQQGNATAQDYEYFRAVEQDYTAKTQEELDAETLDIERGARGSVGMASSGVVDEASTLRTSDNDAVAVAAKSKQGVVQRESEGPASEVRKVELSAEEKAALAAKYAGQPKNKTEVAAAKPAVAPKVIQQVTTEKKIPKKPVVDQVEKRRSELETVGKDLLHLRREARKAAKSGDTKLNDLLRDVKNYTAAIQTKYGKSAHDRIVKEVETLLANENTPAMRPISVGDVISKLMSKRGSSAEIYTDHNGVEHQASRTTTVARLFDELTKKGSFTQLGSDLPSAAGLNMIIPRLLALAGDVKIHVLKSDSTAFATPTFQAAGMYNRWQHVIILSESIFSKADYAAHVTLHEVAHAAFWHSLRDDKRTAGLLEYLRKGVLDTVGIGRLVDDGVDYGFTNVDELISETWSNPKFQRYLADIQIPDELALKLNLPAFKKHSVWSAFVEIVRKALGFAPGTHTALDFVLAATHQLSASRLISDTESYWNNVNNDMFDVPDISSDNKLLPMRAVQEEMVGEMRRKIPGGKFRSAMLKVLTLHQITQLADKYFPQGMALKVSDIIGSIAVRRQELMSDAQGQVVTLTHKLSQQFEGPQWDSFVDIAEQATTSAVDPSVPLSHANNKHVKKGFKWANARAVHKDLNPKWNALPQELKNLWVRSAAFYKDRQDTLTLNHLNNIVESVLGRREEQLAKRIFDGVMTEADRGLFLTNSAMRAIAQAQELKKIQGVYFPKMRRGDHVMTGYYKMTKKYSKNRIRKDEGRYVFDTRAEAEAFQADMRSRGLVVTNTKTYSVDAATNKKFYTYTDPTTGVVIKDKLGAPKQFRYSKGDTGSKEVFETTVQNKLVMFFDTQAQAAQAESDYRQNKSYHINGIQLREELAPASPRASTSQMRRVFKTMESGAKFKEMGGAQKAMLKQAMQELSLGFLSSTAPQNRARPRRNVLGASKEFARNIAEYASASAGAIANSEKQPELAKAITDLEKYSERNASQSGSITYPRSQILQEIRNSVNNQETNKPTVFNRNINYILTMSFLDKLVSPAYHIINSLQPGMVAAPIIGGRHGFSKSYFGLIKAYNAIGSYDVLKSGVKDTKKALTDLMEGTTDYIADMHAKLAKQKDGAELSALMDYLYSTGRINKDAGFEVAELINNPGKFGHALQRADHVVRQFGIAVEVVNRATTAVAAYRLERAKGASVEQAQRYAQEVVTNTQGDYSYSNAPRAFKHPLARVFLQFKKFAQLQYFLLARTAYNAFKGATGKEKFEAAKQLTGMLVAHAAMAGALGLPTEPIKLTLMMLGVLGFPVPQWDDLEQEIAQMAKEYIGDSTGDALMHGLPRLVNIDIHSRVGMNSLLIFGSPRKDDEANTKAWLWDTVTGATFGLGQERIQGVQAVFDGDWWGAAEKLAPFKIAADSIKAAREATEGKLNKRGEQTREPSGVFNTVLRIAGFKPADIARQEEATSAYFTQVGNRKKQRQDLIDRWKVGSRKERMVVQKEIKAYNDTVPKDARISGASLARTLKRSASDKKKGYIKNGIYGGKANKDLLENYFGD